MIMRGFLLVLAIHESILNGGFARWQNAEMDAIFMHVCDAVTGIVHSRIVSTKTQREESAKSATSSPK
jgi:hypothetical protein